LFGNSTICPGGIIYDTADDRNEVLKCGRFHVTCNRPGAASKSAVTLIGLIHGEAACGGFGVNFGYLDGDVSDGLHKDCGKVVNRNFLLRLKGTQGQRVNPADTNLYSKFERFILEDCAVVAFRVKEFDVYGASLVSLENPCPSFTNAVVLSSRSLRPDSATVSSSSEVGRTWTRSGASIGRKRAGTQG